MSQAKVVFAFSSCRIEGHHKLSSSHLALGWTPLSKGTQRPHSCRAGGAAEALNCEPWPWVGTQLFHKGCPATHTGSIFCIEAFAVTLLHISAMVELEVRTWMQKVKQQKSWSLSFVESV